jgi:hypothetical protein
MKGWGDRDPFCGEIKGGATGGEPGRIAVMITSNYSIERCFSHEEDRKAMKRRYNEINMTRANAVLINSVMIDLTQLVT